MAQVIRTTVRAWGLSLLALIAASAGLSAFSASSSTTSLARMGLAAAVLSVYAAAVGLLMTAPSDRTRLRCLLWGGAVPLGVGVATGLVAGVTAGPEAGVFGLLPWLVGVLAAWGLGLWAPALRLPRLPRRRSTTEGYPLG